MNIKKISVKKILDKLNFINKIDDEDDDANYARLDSFTCESDDDFNDYISVDKAYDFRDARKYDELGNLEIDSNHNYLAELAREKRIEENRRGYSMNKMEAIASLEAGNKLTHKDFNPDEWVKEVSRHYLQYEDGYKTRKSYFWILRDKAGMTDNWSIFKE